MKYNFELVKAAQNKGGDRYSTKDGWIIYIPQEISRPSGRPVHDITIEINVGGINPED